MATSSERSPPPFPDSEDQDVLDTEDVGGRVSDEDDGEDLFMSSVCCWWRLKFTLIYIHCQQRKESFS